MSDPSFFERLGSSRAGRYMGGGAQKEYPSAVPTPPMAGSTFGAGFKRWGSTEDVFFGMAETHDTLPCGLFRCESHPNHGPVLVKQKVETDALLELPDDASNSILREFETFWKIGDRFAERGFLAKRGYLLWGPPGSGKTSVVQILVKKLVAQQNGIVLLLEHPHIAAACLQMLRKIEPKRPLIAIMEDMDALVRKFGENEYLALLDGEAQVDCICYLATTNYPEFLDKRFVDRPSRFDTIRYIGMPSAAARRVYLQTKESSLEGDELDEWVQASEGFSVAHLKEMIIAVKCFGQSLEDVVKRLAEMHERKPTSEDSPDKAGAGFLRGMQLGNGQYR